MTGFPKAKSDGLTAMQVADALIVLDPSGGEITRLDNLAAQVWQLADGATSVDAIARDLSAATDSSYDNEFVWSVLDSLADWGLLEARVTPPAGNRSRRGVLKDVVVRGGLIGMAIAAAPAAAFATELSEEEARKHPEAAAREAAEKRSELATEQSIKRTDFAAREAAKKKSELAMEENLKRSDAAARESEGKRGELASEERRKRTDAAAREVTSKDQSAREQQVKRDQMGEQSTKEQQGKKPR
jgi:hypothetical protein